VTQTGWHREFLRPAYWPVADWEYTPERTARELDYLVGRLPAGAGATVLDAGCGLGRHAIGLASRGWRVTGVDCRTDALAEARRRAERAGAAAASFVCADLFAGPPLRGGSVAAAICLQSFGWGSDDDQRALLAGLHHMLAPGGVLVLDVTNPIAIFANYQPAGSAQIDGVSYLFERAYDVTQGRSRGTVVAATAPADPVRHDIRMYTAPEVRGLLAAAGFTVEVIDSDFAAAKPAAMQSRYLQYVARRQG
jgi:SAM-dependent methyltransferase